MFQTQGAPIQLQTALSEQKRVAGPAHTATMPTSPHNTKASDNKTKRESENEKENVTYPFRKQSVTRAEATTVAETHAPAWDTRLVLHDHVLLIVADKVHEPFHELGVSADERTRAVNEDGAIDEVLAEKVAELEELIEGVLVADSFLRAIEEVQLLTRRGRGCCRRDRRGEGRDEGGRGWYLIVLLRHGVCLLDALFRMSVVFSI